MNPPAFIHPSIEAIVFDFDGVLADTAPDIARAAHYTFHCLGLPEPPYAAVRGSIGGGAQELLRRLLGAQSDRYLSEALPIFTARYKQFYCEETCLFPGVPAGLEELQQAGLRLALATNKLEPITVSILGRLGVAAYFSTVIGPESVTHRKPHPEAVLTALSRLKVEPSRALMIGDTAADILAGRAAGTATCGVTYGYGSSQEIQDASPDFIVDRFPNLIRVLLESGT